MATDRARRAAAGRPRSTTWAAYAAGAWALVFAAAHFYWAAGGCAGLPGVDCETAFQRTWFLVYDLVAGALCAVGVVIALALVRPWGRIVRRRLLLAGIAVLVVRGGAGLVQDGLVVAGVIGSERRWDPAMLYDAWFLLGGVLFGLATWFARRRSLELGSGHGISGRATSQAAHPSAVVPHRQQHQRSPVSNR